MKKKQKKNNMKKTERDREGERERESERERARESCAISVQRAARFSRQLKLLSPSLGYLFVCCRMRRPQALPPEQLNMEEIPQPSRPISAPSFPPSKAVGFSNRVRSPPAGVLFRSSEAGMASFSLEALRLKGQPSMETFVLL